MIRNDQHLSWLRSLKRGDLIGISYYNGIQPGIIHHIARGDCRIWGWNLLGNNRNTYNVVENLPLEVYWIPVQEGQYGPPTQNCTVSLRYIKARAYERVLPYPKDFISKKTNEIINQVKKRLF